MPTDLDPATAALVAAPYSPLWNLDAPDDAGWSAIALRGDAAAASSLAKARAALGVSIQPTSIGGVPAFILTPRVIPAAHKRQLIVNLHGGGFIFGKGEAGTAEAMLLAAFGGYKVLAIDYRMPPSAPFPAALDDLVSAWRALTRTTDPRHIAVAGTSAGGGLTLSLMLRAKAEGLPLPAAMALGSPAADLTGGSDSLRTNEWLDNVVVSGDGYLQRVLKLYARGHDPRDPLLSPIFGDFHRLPPAILTTGTRDLLLSDTVRVHRQLRRAGVVADLQVYEGLSHSQFLFDPTMTLPREVYGEVGRFFDQYLTK